MKNLCRSFVLLFVVFSSMTIGKAQCYDQLHTPFADDGWLSCAESVNPNANRPNSHWIMYDLGWEYALDSSYVWNYNAWGNNGYGMKDVIIDYSLDGTNWSMLDTFQFQQATGSIKYGGFKGPNFNSVNARYILLTALSNWGGEPCVGLSEIKIHVSERTTSTDPDLEILADNLEVVPNPVINFANVSVKSEQTPVRVVLYDLRGVEIMVETEIRSKNIQFEMTGLPAGVYTVKAWFEDAVSSTRIIKVGL